MRLVFAGTPEVALPSLRALLDSHHDVVAVVTRPDAPTGRGRTLRPSPVAEVAAEAGLEILRPPSPKDPEFLDRLTQIAPDCAPVVAYGGLLPDDALAIPPHGWVNLHFSLLPAWRGAAPVQRAVLAGDEITGATTFRIVRELDAGPVFGVLTETIRPTDTSGDLLGRLAEAGAGLLLATLDGIEAGSVEAVPQPADGVSLAPKLNPADAEVDWRAPAMHVDRLIRACTPAPAAWTLFRGERVRLGPVTLRQDSRGLAPGELLVEKNAVLVGTGTHGVALGDVTAPGKKPMRAADWARGARPSSGELLGGEAS
ncbi:methionyl-tRNA formyltransferase [Sporichthya brevicatena]|uniref:Methionyl-tRNA formyltransferase n=1 Tax=Sporichthya brevicatena TaxID=171442 RepID=A0ABN1H187_9ACTN